MKENLLIVHGGGPTAVINASLYGAVEEARRSGQVGRILAAKNGTGGLLKEEFIDLTDVPEEKLRLLLQTPGSAIGTSRDQLEQPEYEAMARILEKHDIHKVLMNGGNGTMDTCGKLYKTCKAMGNDILVMGIPKTMDNDLAITDHAPGYGSAARYVAESTKELVQDVKGLPIHVVVLEVSGRNAGWITAASALAADGNGEGPDLIYLPERPFDEDRFISDVKRLLEKKKGIVVVASEGLKDKDGNPIVEPIFKVGRSTYFGDVGTHLANVVIRRLGYKARGEKPGLLGRCSILMQSTVDREEARLAGELACQALLRGETGKMVGFKRISTEPYQVEPILIDIDEVMLHEKTLPDEFINADGNGVTEAFKTWARPLIGQGLDEMISFN
jgi:6-phosphofructokinase